MLSKQNKQIIIEMALNQPTFFNEREIHGKLSKSLKQKVSPFYVGQILNKGGLKRFRVNSITYYYNPVRVEPKMIEYARKGKLFNERQKREVYSKKWKV